MCPVRQVRAVVVVDSERIGMKVIYILPYNWGGMPHYVAEVANSVSKYAEVTVIGSKSIRTDYFTDRVTIIKLFEDLNLSTNYIRDLLSFKIVTLVRALFSFRKIRIVNEIKPDIIHIATPLIPPLSCCIRVYGLDKKFPIVYTKHGVISDASLLEKIFEEYILNFFEKLIDVQKIIVHTENDKLVLTKKLKIAENCVTVVPHGVYTFFRKNVQNGESKNLTVLFFGRIQDYKGLDYLIQSIPSVLAKIPALKVVIAGEGDLSPYQSLIEACDESVFEIHNEFVSDDLVASLFQRSTLVVLPYTKMSGMSGVLNVAYAFGKPVIVSDVGGLDEAVEHGKTGLLVPPKRSSGIGRCYHSVVSRF
jgi:starch synthase